MGKHAKVFQMASAVSRPRGDEARLWAIAIVISLAVNILFVAWISIESIKSEIERRKGAAAPPVPPEQFITISPEMLIPEPLEEKGLTKPKVVRTSPDQETTDPPPAGRRFIGERNTQATSDSAPVANTPDMPSQKGLEPRADEIETTQSDYQSGRKDGPQKPPLEAEPSPVEPTPPRPVKKLPKIVKGEKSPDPGDQEKSLASIRERLLGGPFPLDLPVPKSEYREDIKPQEESKAREGVAEALAEKKAEEAVKLKARRESIDDPAFRGFQRKTAIRGNISRTGTSALDVSGTPMGAYQSKISRAVELAWQRNCVKHRDFITPGYLTVRFFVMADGEVKSIESIGEELTGQVQKGFTFSAIREAGIPPMPAAVRKEMAGDALEIVFRFNF